MPIMGQIKSMLRSAVCGPGPTNGSEVNSDAEDSDAESQYRSYQPLRDLRDARDAQQVMVHLERDHVYSAANHTSAAAVTANSGISTNHGHQRCFLYNHHVYTTANHHGTHRVRYV